MKYEYEVEFTKLGKAFAEAKSSPIEVERLVREELDDMDVNPLEIFFHTVLVGKDCDTGTTFICTPRNGKIVIDTASYEEQPALKDGPFKGRKIMLPKPDSDE